MATTVPQNIKGNKIAGRHTPTRSSLRHSRMLVVNNKNFEGQSNIQNSYGFQTAQNLLPAGFYVNIYKIVIPGIL
ncbi:hypothetical protein DOY81_011521 [Sarcophaga bullata]|nr:hypothetical protein DOY81_011521 [Sarcophaga bullata]